MQTTKKKVFPIYQKTSYFVRNPLRKLSRRDTKVRKLINYFSIVFRKLLGLMPYLSLNKR